MLPEQRVALVTGAGRGIGAAVAARLASAGWSVVLADIDGEAATETAEGLAAAGHLAIGATLDVSDSVAVTELVERIGADLGPILGLVNNAGVLRDGPLTGMTDEDFRKVLDVCLFGAFYCARAVAPAMIEAGCGRIVNVTSRAYLGNPGQANYSSAKAGLVGLAKALAKELGRHQITVNAVAPGMTGTAMVLAHPKADLIIERAAKANSLPRIGRPDDIAGTIAFLLSDDAEFLTGDVMHVTGGRFG